MSWISTRAVPGRPKTSSPAGRTTCRPVASTAARCSGQSLFAAERTLSPGRAAHSMHGYFLRPGDSTQGVTIAIDRIHDGRSFSTRRAQAYQNGVPIFSMIASFQDEAPGLEHAAPMPAGIPQPEDLTSDELLVDGADPNALRTLTERPSTPDTWRRRSTWSRWRACRAPGGLDAASCAHARRSKAPPRGAGVSERHDDPGVHPARPRRALVHARTEGGEPRPCDVVASSGTCRRVDAVRSGVARTPEAGGVWRPAESTHGTAFSRRA